MATVERKIYLDYWVSSQLLRRFSRLYSQDPYAFPMEDYVTAWETAWDYIDKREQDALTEDIFNEFSDYDDIDELRTIILSRCRHLLTALEKRCFQINMNKLASWALENSRITRQLETFLSTSGHLPPEITDYIFRNHLGFPIQNLW